MNTVELAFDVHEYEDTRSDLNPIVMMTGIGWCKFVYSDLARDLCQATKRKVYCLDLRNHGESPSTDDITIELMTEDVKRFLGEQNLKKIAFVCHSFSNSIAYSIALDMPEVVERLLMIDNPPFYDFSEDFNKNMIYNQVMIQNRLLKSLNNKMSMKEAKAKFRNFAKMSDVGHKRVYSQLICSLTKEDGKFGWKKDNNYIWERYEKGFLTMKPRGFSDKEILIIRCENSETVPDHKFKAIQRYNPNAKLITFKNTTHLLMFEQQEKFVQAAKEFLQTSDHHTSDIFIPS